MQHRGFLFLRLGIAAALIPSRVHLIDSYPRGGQEPRNFLFRGNNPAENDTFAIERLLSAGLAADNIHYERFVASGVV